MNQTSIKQETWATADPLDEILNPKTNRTSRIIWVSVVIAGTFGTIFGCVDVIMTYRARPITTEYHIIPNTSMLLPSVHICVQDNLMNSYKTQISANISDNLMQLLGNHLGFLKVPHNLMQEFHKNQTMREEYHDLERKMNATNFLELLSKWAISCEDVISECGYKLGQDCCKEAFKYRAYIGTCFALPPVKQHEAGMFRGVTLGIKPLNARVFLCPKQEFCGMCTGSKSYCSFRQAEIHPPWTSVEVGLRIFEGLAQIKKECLDLTPDDGYSENMCSWKCMLEAVGSVCGCSFLSLPQLYAPLSSDKNLGNCTLWDELQCSSYMQDTQFIGSSYFQEHQKNCSLRCLPPCSRSQFSFFTARNSLATEKTDENIVVDVFYANMEYTYIKQRLSMTFMRALTNLGGHLSLYLGVSLVGLIHTCFLILRYCRNKFTKKPPLECNHDTNIHVHKGSENYLLAITV